MRLATEQVPASDFAVVCPVVAVDPDRSPPCAFCLSHQIGSRLRAPRGSPRACRRPRADCPPRPPDSCGGGDAEEEGAAGGGAHGGGRRPGGGDAGFAAVREQRRARVSQGRKTNQFRCFLSSVAFPHSILPVVCIFKISGLNPLPTTEVSPLLNGISGDRSLWCNAQT